MKLLFDETSMLKNQGILALIYIALMPLGVYNDWVIMDDVSSAIFNIIFSSIVFLSVLYLQSKLSLARLIATVFLGILFLFSIMGLVIFATSGLTYSLFTYHLVFSGFSIYVLWGDEKSKSLFS